MARLNPTLRPNRHLRQFADLDPDGRSARRLQPRKPALCQGSKEGRHTDLARLGPASDGAECHDGLLQVDVPLIAPAGFQDILSLVFGSYNLGDYGVFYSSIRANLTPRIDAWTVASQHSTANAGQFEQLVHQ